MNKAFYNFVWENFPSDKTPVNDANLMKINNGLDEVDNRIILLDSTKFDKSEAQLLVKYIEYDEDTGIFKITHYNGASYEIDTLLEKLAINFDYDYQTQRLIIELSDGTIKYVDLSALITQYEFLDSETVRFTIRTDGKVVADIIEGSIQEKHLRPDYLADIKVEVAKAESSATSAATSATNAKKSEIAAKKSEAAAKESEANTKTSEANAEESATSAAQNAAAAEGSAAAAKASEAAAKESEANTKTSEANAAKSETSAAKNASTATSKAAEASGYADVSQSYAVGTGGEVRENDDFDCAKYYYEQSKKISQSISGVVPMGTISFSDLNNADNQKSGYLFNISDSFTSDDRFADGGGIFYGAGSNLIYTADGKWDVLAAAMVSGVKGIAESEYRQGFVNIASEDVGALPVEGNAVSATKAMQDGNGKNIADTYLKKTGDAENNTVSFASNDSKTANEWNDVEVLKSEEKFSVILNKISTMFKNVRYIFKILGTTSISGIGDGTVTGAISELNTDMKYRDITDQISIDIPGSKYAYVERGLVHVTLIANTINSGVKNIIIPREYAPRIVTCGSISYVGLSSDAGKIIAAYIMSDGTGALQAIGDIGTVYVTFIWPLPVH